MKFTAAIEWANDIGLYAVDWQDRGWERFWESALPIIADYGMPTHIVDDLKITEDGAIYSVELIYE